MMRFRRYAATVNIERDGSLRLCSNRQARGPSLARQLRLELGLPSFLGSDRDYSAANSEVWMIVKVKEGYQVLSEKGKNLGGPYKTREEADRRLRQVEFFKHNKLNARPRH